MELKRSIRVGLTAPSSPVSPVELKLGLEKLRSAGLEPIVSPQVKRKDGLYAGTDEERAEAFHAMARDPSVPIVWAARGGYGAIRILEVLEKLDEEKGAPPPGKLYVGFSDFSALYEYIRSKWHGSLLHASMPGHRGILELPKTEWKAIIEFLNGDLPALPKAFQSLQWIGGEGVDVEAEMTGGNLATWMALIGTRFAPDLAGKILFIEEISETWSRIDRMVEQLMLSGKLEGVPAIVLGNFMDCVDLQPVGLASERSRKKMKPLRKTMNPKQALSYVFERLSTKWKIPVAVSIPSGHGPGKFPLPIDATFRLSEGKSGKGNLEILDWRWKGVR